MESELQDLNPNSKSNHHQPPSSPSPDHPTTDDASTNDDRPLLKPNSTTATSQPDIDELEKKFAAYVRHDVYGTMGRGELPLSEKVMLGVALVTLLPVRVVLATTLLVVYYLICRICTLCSAPNREDEQEDYANMRGWKRSIIVQSGRFLSRSMLFVLGFYWIRETYRWSDIDNNNSEVGSSLLLMLCWILLDFTALLVSLYLCWIASLSMKLIKVYWVWNTNTPIVQKHLLLKLPHLSLCWPPWSSCLSDLETRYLALVSHLPTTIISHIKGNNKRRMMMNYMHYKDDILSILLVKLLHHCSFQHIFIVNIWRQFPCQYTYWSLFMSISSVYCFSVIGQTECKDQSQDDLDRPGAIVSNHISYLDILYHMSSSFPSFVAKVRELVTPLWY